jgi:NAD(P)H-dependent FMN reductase
MISLKIIIASTRPGRKGVILADWILEKARAHQEFDIEMIDLAVINLPFMDEPHHPRLQQYTHQHTRDWSLKIAGADAFIFVTPEYNHGYPATIKNAIDFLYNEWRHKPVGFVSYGGISGGTRSIQLLKPVLASLDMVPLTAAVNVPFFTKFIKDDVFSASDDQNRMADGLFIELKKWSESLAHMRNPDMVKS